jgi:hypothetical protein
MNTVFDWTIKQLTVPAGYEIKGLPTQVVTKRK